MNWKEKFAKLINSNYTKHILHNYVYYMDPVCERIPFYILYDVSGNKLSEKYIIDDDIVTTKYVQYSKDGSRKVALIHLSSKSHSILRDYEKKCDYYIRESSLGWISANVKPNFLQYSNNGKIVSVDTVDLRFVL